MQYIVIRDFSDIQDGRHVYLTGDTFPREGLDVSEERVAELASKNNVRGEVLIKAVSADNEVTENENDGIENENDIIEAEDEPKKNRKKKEK